MHSHLRQFLGLFQHRVEPAHPRGEKLAKLVTVRARKLVGRRLCEGQSTFNTWRTYTRTRTHTQTHDRRTHTHMHTHMHTHTHIHTQHFSPIHPHLQQQSHRENSSPSGLASNRLAFVPTPWDESMDTITQTCAHTCVSESSPMICNKHHVHTPARYFLVPCGTSRPCMLANADPTALSTTCSGTDTPTIKFAGWPAAKSRSSACTRLVPTVNGRT